MNDKVKDLEKRDHRKNEEQLALAEATQAVVEEEIGKLVDAAREDPELVLDEEDTSVRRLVKKTGRSGSHPAVQSPASEKKRD